MRSTRLARHLLLVLPLVQLAGAAGEVQAAKLVDVAILDKDYLVVHLSDGYVIHEEGGVGETILRYTPELDTSAAVQTGSCPRSRTAAGTSSTGRPPI